MRGKRASANNALRHGLSVPLGPEVMGPTRAKIASLLAPDSLDASVALDLADKVFQYERNLAHQRELFLKVYVHRVYEPEASERRMLEQNPELDLMKDLIDYQRYFIGRVNLRDLRFVSTRTLRLRHSWARIEMRSELKEKVAAQRYMRGSTNQLLKCLKRLK